MIHFNYKEERWSSFLSCDLILIIPPSIRQNIWFELRYIKHMGSHKALFGQGAYRLYKLRTEKRNMSNSSFIEGNILKYYIYSSEEK